MPTVPIPPVEHATPDQRAYFDAVVKRMGGATVPLITRAMAMKLDLAVAHSKGMGLVMGETDDMPGWFKEMIAVAASAVFACDY